jgi:hypothetical protein
VSRSSASAPPSATSPRAVSAIAEEGAASWPPARATCAAAWRSWARSPSAPRPRPSRCRPRPSRARPRPASWPSRPWASPGRPMRSTGLVVQFTVERSAETPAPVAR